MKKFVASALVAAAFSAATPAMATELALEQSADGTYSATTGFVSKTAGSFTDTYTFNVPSVGKVGASVISLSITGAIQLLSGTLNGTALIMQQLGTDSYVLRSADGGQLTIDNPQKLIINGNVTFRARGVLCCTAICHAAPAARSERDIGGTDFSLLLHPGTRFVVPSCRLGAEPDGFLHPAQLDPGTGRHHHCRGRRVVRLASFAGEPLTIK